MLHLLDQLNPLSPMRDQDRISPCNENNVKQINDKNKENICKTHQKQFLPVNLEENCKRYA